MDAPTLRRLSAFDDLVVAPLWEPRKPGVAVWAKVAVAVLEIVHEDFGGHRRRDEFVVDTGVGRHRVGPITYRDVAMSQVPQSELAGFVLANKLQIK